ncbi:MAG: choice-of-anchor D domain-containing protein, partial [Calditrichaeota bacterium]|nr:choice-of-anchor D domain-containing protein [Calditrichota bacterium]
LYATQNSSPRLEWVTVASNVAQDVGGAVYAANNSTIEVHNSILYFNSPAAVQNNPPVDVNYTDIEGGHGGDGNFAEDPRFADRNNGDYRLSDQSPCIDRGDPDSPEDIDESRTDLGAFGYIHIPILRVGPEQVAFGDVTLGHFAESGLQIANIGQAALRISEIALVPDDGPFIILAGDEPAELFIGDAVDVQIRFEPTEVGDFEAALRITSNDPNNGVLDVPVLGTGFPRLPRLEVVPLLGDFGEVPLRQEASIPLNLFNLGEADLNVTRIAITGDTTGWFRTNFNGAFAVGEGDSSVIEAVFQPLGFGEHHAILVIESNDPDSATFSISLTAIGSRPPAHFQFTDNTGVNHSLLVLTAAVDGEDLTFGSEVAVFTPEGLCCGAELYLGERIGLAAWGDNDQTEAIDGFREDEGFHFKFYDIAANEELDAEAEFVQGDQDYQDNGISVLNLAASQQGGGEEPEGHWIGLNANWNLMSSPAMPENRDVRAIFQPLVERGSIIIVKDHTGRFYAVLQNFSNMLPWDYRYGYQVKMVRNDSLFIRGGLADPVTVIPLRLGWSYTAYFPDRELDARTAFANIRNVLNIAKDGGGRFYVPRINFSNMHPLRRGLGYQVKLDEAVDFVWNIPEGAPRQASPVGRSSSLMNVHFADIAPTGQNMSVILRWGKVASGENRLHSPLEIGAYTSSGNLVGSTRLEEESPWGLAVWGDDVSTDPVDGALEGEAITFRIWDGHSEQVAIAHWTTGDSRYRTDGFAVVELTPSPALPVQVWLHPPQPNPFNSTLRIAFDLPVDVDAQLTLYDLTGREAASLLSGPLDAGQYVVGFEAGTLPAGLYMLRLTAGATVRSAKVVLVK